MAVLSHIPQLVASILAGELEGIDVDALQLVGQGFRDTTRLADSDAEIWSSIVESNRSPIAAGLRGLGRHFDGVAEALEDGSSDEAVAVVRSLMVRGGKGRGLLPPRRKAEGPAVVRLGWVAVVLEDRTGQLGELFTAIGDWGINVEDVGSFEHGLGGRAGIVEIAVAEEVADDLVDRLAGKGWTAYRRS
jgi:prephenate dehydrogenase